MQEPLEIPRQFIDVEYESSRIPGAPNQSDLSLGANCQVYAYELLTYFNKHPLQFRSSELWSDTTYTTEVVIFERLDLMLYNKIPKSYGAHVAVYIGNGKIIHLSQAIGKPEIINHNNMLLTSSYNFFIGAKRVIENTS